MRYQFYAFLVVAVFAAALFGASAFNAADTGTRSVTASVVGDSSAYLAVAVNGSSPHTGFVTTSGGKVVMSFGSGVATGTGINPEATYYFDDLLNITNQGTKTANVWVNSTATAGTVKICLKTAGNLMADNCYGTSTFSSILSLTAGSKLSLGVMVQANSVASGSSVTGTISIYGGR